MVIKINRDSFPKVEEKLLSEDFERVPMADGKGCDYVLKGIGKFRIFNNGTVQPQGKDTQKLEEYWNTKFGDLSLKSDSDEKINMFFSYTLTPEQIIAIQKELQRFSMASGITLTEVKADYAMYRYIITNPPQQKVTITQYEKRILMQGLRTQLWQDISNVIAKKLDVVFETLVGQVVAEPGKTLEIVGLVQADDQERATQAVRSALGDCYDYLWDHNKNDVESAQCALDTYQNLKDYFLCVCSTIRALEGFIKQLVVDIGAFTEMQITQHNWDFGEIINGGDLTRAVEIRLSRDKALKEKQKQALMRIVRKGIFELRHNLFHTGPYSTNKPIPQLSIARSYHDEILGMMNTTYQLLRTEIKP